jgi:type II secretory pathway component GspD/PulD (secretin)
MVMIAAAALSLTAGCGGQGGGPSFRGLEVRTFKVQYIQPEAAARIIDPYVFVDRGGSRTYDNENGLITVRETPEMLSRIEEVLARYDVAEPSVQLHFRLIEADGAAASDPALDDIRAALPSEVFRFRNYQQVAEAVMTGSEWGNIAQEVATPKSRYHIEGRIGEVRRAEDGGTVQLEVALSAPGIGTIFGTSVNARVGQLLVLGSAQPQPRTGALILAVRAELVQP